MRVREGRGLHAGVGASNDVCFCTGASWMDLADVVISRPAMMNYFKLSQINLNLARWMCIA